MSDNHREAGEIESVLLSTVHGADTIFVGIVFSGSGQGFGGLYLPDKDTQTLFMNMLMATFGVKEEKELVGKKCFGLRAFTSWSSPLVGIESADTGLRMTITAFRRRLAQVSGSTEETLSEFDAMRQSLERDLAHLERRKQEINRELANLAVAYKEWD